MALARTNLLGAISSTGLGTGGYTTSSFTPPSNSLLVVAVGGMGGSGVAITGTSLTCAGGGWTFTSRAAIDHTQSSFDTGLRIFTAPVSTGVSMTLTVTHGASNMEFMGVSVVAYTGYDTSTPTGATITGIDAGADSAINLTLSGAPASTSEVFAALTMDKESTGTTPGTGWSEIHEVQASASGGMESEIRTGSTSTAVEWVDPHTGTGVIFHWVAAAVEIREGTAAVVDTNQAPRIPFPAWAPPWIGPRPTPPQLLGNAVTDQWPALPDTAVGTDAVVVAAAVPLADTAAADDSLTVAAAVPLADPTNATTDDLSVVLPQDPNQASPRQFWSQLNPGTGPHAPVLQLLGDASSDQLLTLADSTNAADDALTAGAAVPLSEDAAAVDALAAVAAIPLADTASGVDALAVATAFAVADTASGDDSLSVQTVGIADAFQSPRWWPGMLFDPRVSSSQLLGDSTSVVTLADTAAAADVLVVAPAIPLTDTATGDDALTVAATLTLTAETAAGTDALAATAVVTLTDTAAVVDALSVAVADQADQNQWMQQPAMDPPPLQLLGDAAVASASIGLAEDASAADSLSISVTITMADTAAASDVMLASVAQPSLSELVSAADALAITVLLGLAETASTTEDLFIGGSGIQGNVYPRPSSGVAGSSRPRETAGIIGSVG